MSPPGLSSVEKHEEQQRGGSRHGADDDMRESNSTRSTSIGRDDDMSSVSMDSRASSGNSSGRDSSLSDLSDRRERDSARGSAGGREKDSGGASIYDRIPYDEVYQYRFDIGNAFNYLVSNCADYLKLIFGDRISCGRIVSVPLWCKTMPGKAVKFPVSQCASVSGTHQRECLEEITTKIRRGGIEQQPCRMKTLFEDMASGRRSRYGRYYLVAASVWPRAFMRMPHSVIVVYDATTGAHCSFGLTGNAFRSVLSPFSRQPATVVSPDPLVQKYGTSSLRAVGAMQVDGRTADILARTFSRPEIKKRRDSRMARRPSRTSRTRRRAPRCEGRDGMGCADLR
jgi:hypothetical protein